MLNGKKYKVIVDHNNSHKGIYVRDIPCVMANVLAEFIAEAVAENKKNMAWFASGAVVAAVVCLAWSA
jgi:hypothetical protein